MRDRFQALATHVAPLYKQLAPQAYSNQVCFRPDVRRTSRDAELTLSSSSVPDRVQSSRLQAGFEGRPPVFWSHRLHGLLCPRSQGPAQPLQWLHSGKKRISRGVIEGHFHRWPPQFNPPPRPLRVRCVL